MESLEISNGELSNVLIHSTLKMVEVLLTYFQDRLSSLVRRRHLTHQSRGGHYLLPRVNIRASCYVSDDEQTRDSPASDESCLRSTMSQSRSWPIPKTFIKRKGNFLSHAGRELKKFQPPAFCSNCKFHIRSQKSSLFLLPNHAISINQPKFPYLAKISHPAYR